MVLKQKLDQYQQLNISFDSIKKTNIYIKDNIYIWFFNKIPNKDNLFYQIIKKINIGFNKTKDIFHLGYIDIKNKKIGILITKQKKENNLTKGFLTLYTFNYKESDSNSEFIVILDYNENIFLELINQEKEYSSDIYFDFQIKINNKDIDITIYDFITYSTFLFNINRLTCIISSYIFPKNKNILDNTIQLNDKTIKSFFRLDDFTILFDLKNLTNLEDINSFIEYIKKNRLYLYNLIFKKKKIFLYKILEVNNQDKKENNIEYIKKNLEILILDQISEDRNYKNDIQNKTITESNNNSIDEFVIDNWEL